jgi:alpha-D-ribose 1-methylphosphonate 5-triphosphate synthase subunit PhnH
MIGNSTIPSGAVRPPTELSLRDPIRASQHIFRVVLDALANPGTVRDAIVHPRVAAEELAANPWLASVLVTLLDHEVSLHVAEGPGFAELGQFLVRRTRTTLTTPGEATFVVSHVSDTNHDIPELLKRGSLEYPDDGATLLVEVTSLDQELASDLELTLLGPGIAGSRVLRVDGLRSGWVHSRNRATANYPTGIDVVFIDPEGRLVGLPRTTELSIYAEGRR